MIYHQCIGGNGGSEHLLGFICFNFPELAVKSEKQKNFNIEGLKESLEITVVLAIKLSLPLRHMACQMAP